MRQLVSRPGSGSSVTCGVTEPVHRIPIQALRPSDSPRSNGVCPNHVRALAESDAVLPPIIVHRPAMRVIDGMHRLKAAQLRGESLISVIFFDGDDDAAFLLAVEANTRHGLPLTCSDRKAAAQRILRSTPDLSDRAVAEASGISAKVVAALRAELPAAASGQAFRVGRDGRSRPVDPAAARERVRTLIATHPDASLRFIARRAGVSPTTVRAVRESEQVAQPVENRAEAASAPATAAAEPADIPTRNVRALLTVLAKDPSLRLSEDGRQIIKLLATTISSRDFRYRVSQSVPAHAAGLVAEVSRACATMWTEFADELERDRVAATDCA